MLAGEFDEHAGDHGRCELLGRQSVATTRYARHHRPLPVGIRLGESGDHVQIERFADRPRLLGAVQNADRTYRRGQCVQ